MLPGLLQTPEYASAYLRAAGRARDEEQIEQEVALRVAQQEILLSPKLIAAWFVLDESVLYRPYVGRTAIREQLIKLEQTAKLPNVVRVVFGPNDGCAR